MKNKLPFDIRSWFKSLPDLISQFYTGNFKNQTDTTLNKILDTIMIANFTLWGYEDQARRNDLRDKEIVNLKRNIDKENQRRNNLIDYLDMLLLQDIEKKLKSIDNKAPLNSETPASIFDRLTILALRSYHLKKETNRKDADTVHIKKCSSMFKQVEEHSRDLLKCLKDLLEDYYSGKKRLKSYKQHKLYNDPELNPALRKLIS